MNDVMITPRYQFQNHASICHPKFKNKLINSNMVLVRRHSLLTMSDAQRDLSAPNCAVHPLNKRPSAYIQVSNINLNNCFLTN